VNRALVVALAGFVVALVFPAHPMLGQPPEGPAAEAVVGLSVRSTHRAYPTSLFSAHRVINDTVGGMEVVVFHDAERGLSAAWLRMVCGEPIEFSGAAVGSVADDVTTVTRWDLSTGVAVGGNLQGQRLVPLPVATTTWAGWSAAHPGAEVFRAAR
jgi:hypothetical protein